jgi:hypothetical protein
VKALRISPQFDGVAISFSIRKSINIFVEISILFPVISYLRRMKQGNHNTYYQDAFYSDLEFLPQFQRTFTDIQLIIFNKLCDMYVQYDYYRKYPTTEDYYWDGRTWAQIIFICVQKLANTVSDVQYSCWFAKTKNNKPYPSIKFTIGWKYINIAGQGWRWRSDISKQKTLPIHRLIAALVFPGKLTYLSGKLCDPLQVAHNCKHKCQTCWNPFHLRLDNDANNKDDIKCTYGAAFLCPHGHCIWTDTKGEPIPCRNSKAIHQQCTHTPNCYTRRVFE